MCADTSFCLVDQTNPQNCGCDKHNLRSVEFFHSYVQLRFQKSWNTMETEIKAEHNYFQTNCSPTACLQSVPETVQKHSYILSDVFDKVANLDQSLLMKDCC